MRRSGPRPASRWARSSSSTSSATTCRWPSRRSCTRSSRSRAWLPPPPSSGSSPRVAWGARPARASTTTAETTRGGPGSARTGDNDPMSAEPAPLHTLEYGDHGPRVVFCHGLFGQGRNWSTLGRALADEHRVTLVDLPHHGRSPWRDRFDYVAMADEIAGLLDPADAVTLVGHSMGDM